MVRRPILKCKSELLIVDDSHFMFFNQRSSQTAMEMFGFVKDVVDTGLVTVLFVGDVSIEAYVQGIDSSGTGNGDPISSSPLRTIPWTSNFSATSSRVSTDASPSGSLATSIDTASVSISTAAATSGSS